MVLSCCHLWIDRRNPGLGVGFELVDEMSFVLCATSSAVFMISGHLSLQLQSYEHAGRAPSQTRQISAPSMLHFGMQSDRCCVVSFYQSLGGRYSLEVRFQLGIILEARHQLLVPVTASRLTTCSSLQDPCIRSTHRVYSSYEQTAHPH